MMSDFINILHLYYEFFLEEQKTESFEETYTVFMLKNIQS